MLGSKNRKREEAEDKIAVGYMLMSQIPDGKVMDVGPPLKTAAAEWGYSWGGTYLDHSTGNDTVAAIERAASFNRAITLVVVPTEAHLPRGRRTLTTGHGPIRVVTPDSDEPIIDTQAQEPSA